MRWHAPDGIDIGLHSAARRERRGCVIAIDSTIPAVGEAWTHRLRVCIEQEPAERHGRSPDWSRAPVPDDEKPARLDSVKEIGVDRGRMGTGLRLFPVRNFAQVDTALGSPTFPAAREPASSRMLER